MNYHNNILMTLLIGISVFILLTNCAGAATWTVDPTGAGDYTTVQAAINAASAADTILVQSGTYYENVNVNKALTLRGVNSGSSLPVVDAGGSGSAITISADGCTLQDFVARNSGYSGIWVSSSYNTISSNTATGNSYGIAFYRYSNNNTISGNTANGNRCGIYFYRFNNDNTISDNTATGENGGIYLSYYSNGNTISGNTANGIYLDSCNGNTISGNTATHIFLHYSSNNAISGNTVTGNLGYGIYLDSSCNGNTISGNTVNGKSVGINLYSSCNGNTISGNTATGNHDCGIYLFSCSSNTISGNTVNDSRWGIQLYSSSNNTISGNNKVIGNSYGIYLDSSSKNTISYNTAKANANWDIYLNSPSNDNIIYLNTLDSGWSNGANHWNSTTEIAYGNATTYVGNYWSGYASFDCNGDGIGDTPYLIEGGSDRDYHPIGGNKPSPGLEAEKIADRSEAEVGDWINYTVHVNNIGNVNLTSVQAEDNLTGAIWNAGTLAPGQNYTNTTRYQVSISDLPGPLINELRANGTDPCGGEVNDSAIETVNITGQSLNCIEGWKIDSQTGQGIAGWTISLSNDSGIRRNTSTNDIGWYKFWDLEPGRYRVCEGDMPGWTNVTPSCIDVDLGLADEINQNFTNQKLLCIGGYKVDACNGTLPGWEMVLSNSSGEVERTLTNDSGYYQFCNLSPGAYRVCETPQDGWLALENLTCFDVVLGFENQNQVNFVNARPLCISGRKTHDITGQGLAGWTINITNRSGQVLDSTTTNETGYYQFCNLPRGTYTICETLQPGWLSSPEIQLNDDGTIQVNDGICKNVSLSCVNQTGIDFSNSRSLCVGGRKVNDCTNEGIEGWEIRFRHVNAGNWGTATTNETGYWQQCGLLPGEYIFCEEIRAGWRNVTDSCIELNLTDSDIMDLEFRNTPLGCLSGYKLNEGGYGLTGWTIEVRNASGLVNSSVTDSSGFWQVCGLHPGTYEVSEVLQGNYKISLHPQSPWIWSIAPKAD